MVQSKFVSKCPQISNSRYKPAGLDFQFIIKQLMGCLSRATCTRFLRSPPRQDSDVPKPKSIFKYFLALALKRAYCSNIYTVTFSILVSNLFFLDELMLDQVFQNDLQSRPSSFLSFLEHHQMLQEDQKDSTELFEVPRTIYSVKGQNSF